MAVTESPFRVLVAGGGVAALETILALRELAGKRVQVQLLAPEAEFVYRPMTVVEPFAHAAANHYRLDTIAADADAELIVDAFAWVDPLLKLVHTKDDISLPYDALVLALGARMQPAFANATTIDDRQMDEQLHGIVQDVELGYIRRIAFVAPSRIPWPLPIYELALMTARRAYDMDVKVEITLVTPEPSPLAVFGDSASREVADLLRGAEITTICSVQAQVPEPCRVTTNHGRDTLEVDRVIALPELFGPAVRGLRAGDHGFIPIDRHCRVRGALGIYAVGDATDFAIKHGGIAAQQADCAAASIAASAGATVSAPRLDPEIHGVLLTGGKPRYLNAQISGSGSGTVRSEVTDEPTWAPSTKIAARYLAPYLDRLDRSPVAG
jgi:sulfide:quinone oxidoreductase